MKRILLILAVIASMTGHAETIGELVKVSVPDGAISPTGFVATISSVAQIAAQAQAISAQADAMTQAAADASNAVDQVRVIVNGLEGIGYIRGYVESFGAGITANTNTVATIVKFEAAGTTSTTSLWRAYTYFTEDPGSFPVMHYTRSLGSTNAWDTATQVSVVLTNTIVNGTQYECYANTVAMPLAYTSAFFRTFADISGGGTNQTYMPVRNGVSVNGAPPLTMTFTSGTNVFRIIGGVLCQ